MFYVEMTVGFRPNPQNHPVEASMADVHSEIQAMVDRETAAWNARDAEALDSIFHPDMVWPWPPDATAHDPESWVFLLGRYDRDRWQAGWQELFDAHDLIHNNRRTVRIEVSDEGDGAFAVVDVDIDGGSQGAPPLRHLRKAAWQDPR